MYNNDIDYNNLSGNVIVTVRAQNNYDTEFTFSFTAYIDRKVSPCLRRIHFEDIATHLTWLRGLFCGKIIKIEKSNLTEVIK